MSRENVNDLYLFLAVAEERSFTRAAARLGMSQSALSHAVRALEARLGVRLLSRTTRSVSPTDAGERLVKNVAPRLAEIGAELTAVSDLGDKPAGTIRITAIDHVIDQVLWPRLAGVLEQYPDVHVEISSRLPPDRRRRRALRHRRALRGSGGEGHGGRAPHPRRPDDDRRLTAVLRNAQDSRRPERSGSAQLHHPATLPAAASMPGSCAGTAETSRSASQGR